MSRLRKGPKGDTVERSNTALFRSARVDQERVVGDRPGRGQTGRQQGLEDRRQADVPGIRTNRQVGDRQGQ